MIPAFDRMWVTAMWLAYICFVNLQRVLRKYGLQPNTVAG